MMHRTPSSARAFCVAAAMFAALGSSAVFAQVTDAPSDISDNAPATDANNSTATGTTSRIDDPM